LIQIFGVGCSKCRKLTRNVEEAVKVLQIESEIQKISDVNKFVDFEVIIVPTLIINSKIVSVGSVLSVNKIKAMLIDYAKTEK